MASKSFTLAESPEGGGKSTCAKLCICTCALGFIGLLGFAGVYVYQTFASRCSYPELDEFGLSNWTRTGTDEVAFSCFPGYYLEGESNLEVSKCKDGLWEPLPPACNSLPIRIDCHVNNQSLTGNVTMWQESIESPTHIYGLINYSEASKPQGHLAEYVIISKKTCNVSHVIPGNISELDPEHTQPRRRVIRAKNLRNETTTTTTTTTSGDDKDDDDDNDDDDEDDEDKDEHEHSSTHDQTTDSGEDKDDKDKEEKKAKVIRVHFHSDDLKAYKKTEVVFNIVFVDAKTTASLVTVHQHNLTLVHTSSNPIHSLNATWNWDKETRGGMQFNPRI